MTVFVTSPSMPVKQIHVMEDPMALEVKSNRGTTPVIVEDAPQRKSLRCIWTEFGEATSMHGLGRAINGKRIWKRAVWAIMVVVATCVAVWNFYEIIDNFLDYPVITSVTVKSSREMIFPAVTICNLNPNRLTALSKRIQEALNASVEDRLPAPKQRRIYRKLLNSVYSTRLRNSRDSNIYYTMQDMLVGCEFDLATCDSRDFRSFNSNEFGRCFTFNADQDEPKSIQRAGNINGLVLELDIQANQYLPFVSTAGIKVLVHPQSDVPFPEDSGIIAGPGRATSIGIRKRSISRQPPPWGPCINAKGANNRRINMFSDIYEYTSAVCEKTCYQRTVVEECGCCDQDFPCNETALAEVAGYEVEDEEIDECDESKNRVAHCLTGVLRNYYSGNLSCTEACSPACKEIIYATNYATGSWPGHNFERTLIAKARQAQRVRKNVIEPYPEPITSSFIAENFLRVEVYFENFVEEVITTTPAYDWSRLLSDVGGQMGLWLGFSIMTAFELLELIFDISGYIVRRVRSARILKTAPGNLF